MENNFDRLIKQKLESLDVEYNPSDWDRMEEKIVEQSELNPAIEDVYLDGMVYDTLNDVDVEFNPAHWEMMKARLEDPYAIRRRLMKYKVLEVALVALLLITIGRLVPFEKARRANVPTDQLNAQTKDPIATTFKKEIIDHQSVREQLEKKDIVKEVFTPTNDAKLAAGYSIIKDNASELASENEGFGAGDVSELLKNDLAVDNSLFSFENTDGIVSDDGSLVENALVETPLEVEVNDTNNGFTEESNFSTTVPMDALALKDTEIFLPQVDEMDGSRVLTSLPKTIKVRIGMVLGPDANYVMTPSNRSKDLDVFNQYALGYSGGFTLGFNYGHWEVETGALYSAVSYDSRNIFEIKGSFADGGYVQQGLEGAQLDILRIPLNIKYNFTDRGKWNFYAFSGVSANANLETFYKITTTDLGLSDASRNFAGRAPSPPDIEPQKAQENFDGIFEGGLLSKNLFYTANLGLGIERYFTPRMSIFLQPNFQYHFSKGLGPQTDRINSVSLLAGAKVTLKKRKK